MVRAIALIKRAHRREIGTLSARQHTSAIAIRGDRRLSEKSTG
jgi:hypothetical protein